MINKYYFSNEKYTLTYDANGGSGTYSDPLSPYRKNALVTVAQNQFTKSGYTFSEWKLNNTSTTYNPGDTFNILSDTTLYALWNANTYTITFNKNGGRGGTDSLSVTYDSPVNNILIPIKIGYTFDGYGKYKTSTGWDFLFDSQGHYLYNTYTLTFDKELFAKWNPNLYTITFDKNGGSGGTSSLSVLYDSTPNNITVPDKVGYTFNGYYIGDSTTQYYNTNGIWQQGVYTYSSDITLNARYAINLYIVTVSDPIFNSTCTGSGTYNYNDSVTISAPNPPTGWAFGSWDDLSDSSASLNPRTVTVNSDYNYYVIYRATSYRRCADLYFTGNGVNIGISMIPDREQINWNFEGRPTRFSGGQHWDYDVAMVSCVYKKCKYKIECTSGTITQIIRSDNSTPIQYELQGSAVYFDWSFENNPGVYPKIYVSN